jgi:hypothetical protein
MPKLSANMYGTDDTGMAESIASDALDTAGTGWGHRDQADYWGKTDDDRSLAKGNTPEYEDYAVDILRETRAGGGDVEDTVSDYPQTSMMPRHVPGPKTAAAAYLDKRKPPARQTSTKAGTYSKYNVGPPTSTDGIS